MEVLLVDRSCYVELGVKRHSKPVLTRCQWQKLWHQVET